MNKPSTYSQGGDAQAIQRIANRYYGSYANMFKAHGWLESGSRIMPVVQTRVVETYGSVHAFEQAHPDTEFMFPMEAIKGDPPNVWLTSFYGFRPWDWGLLGFADEVRRRNFLEHTKPGVLVVIYGAGKAKKEELGFILGIQQCSHQIGMTQEFMSPAEWELKSRNPETADKWNFAVKATRAWRVSPETRIAVEEFAPESTSSGAWQHIGSRGVRLTTMEANKILKLDLQEVDVYGENPIVASTSATALEILAPSKAGPVSQNPHVVKEAEGPKHLYILRLEGNDIDTFLGRPANGKVIVKAGFSRSPQSRCADINRALPKCAYNWKVWYSGKLSNYQPHPTSHHAKAGERAMQSILCQAPHSESLGGEFFLAEPSQIERAWIEGNQIAKEYKK